MTAKDTNKDLETFLNKWESGQEEKFNDDGFCLTTPDDGDGPDDDDDGWTGHNNSHFERWDIGNDDSADCGGC